MSVMRDSLMFLLGSVTLLSSGWSSPLHKMVYMLYTGCSGLHLSYWILSGLISS